MLAVRFSMDIFWVAMFPSLLDVLIKVGLEQRDEWC